MALSPSVEAREVDRTLNVNNIVTNGSGYVGLFNWGPVNQVINISTNESELVRRVGRPDSKTTLFFHSAYNYLLYANPLLVVRASGSGATNAVPDNIDSSITTTLSIANDNEYESSSISDIPFFARYVGELGNSILVSAANSEDYSSWQYRNLFNYEPTEQEEFNLVIIDRDGSITGTAGTVLEQYELVSTKEGSRKSDGSTAFITNVLQRQSNYLLVGDLSAFSFNDGLYEVALEGGSDDNDIPTADFVSAWEVFSSESYDIARVFTAGNPPAGIIRAVDIAEDRRDFVVFVSPELEDVLNSLDPAEEVLDYYNTKVNVNSSYLFATDNWKQVFDKYRDNYIWIPIDSDVAALHARVSIQNEAWFSPAGMNRGQIKNAIKLAWSSERSQRNRLYKANINSVVSFENEGIVLWGDKMKYSKPSTFNRINVRTLFIILRKNISQAARHQLFEFNDYITRTTFKRATDSYLENVQARRGLDAFRVVCDESNNTAGVINNNEFVGDIYIRPLHSINFIRLNFIATPYGVDFSEIEG